MKLFIQNSGNRFCSVWILSLYLCLVPVLGQATLENPKLTIQQTDKKKNHQNGVKKASIQESSSSAIALEKKEPSFSAKAEAFLKYPAPIIFSTTCMIFPLFGQIITNEYMVAILDLFTLRANTNTYSSMLPVTALSAHSVLGHALVGYTMAQIAQGYVGMRVGRWIETRLGFRTALGAAIGSTASLMLILGGWYSPVLGALCGVAMLGDLLYAPIKKRMKELKSDCQDALYPANNHRPKKRALGLNEGYC